MKKLLAGFFLFIFSFQILPVKELGKFLFKNQLTEEIKESDYAEGEYDGENLKLKKESDPLMNHGSHEEKLARLEYLSHSLQTALHEAERLPLSHIADIFTPPPNC
jgi:hypothetical protein